MELFVLSLIFGFSAIALVLVRRLYFHPLARIPGPKLAALSSLYEFYYDCLKGGKFAFKIVELHSRYGPIVRIGPNEVHIDDPTYFDELYNVAGKLDKDKWYYSFVASQDAGFGTSNAELHRARRKAMSKFFSSSAISNLETTTEKNVTLLCQRLDEFKREGKPVNLSNAFRCLAADSVTNYCMPEPFNLLKSIDFADEYNQQARTMSYISVWHRHIPIIIPIFMTMPRWVVKLTPSKGGLQTFDFQSSLARQAKEVASSQKRNDNSVLEGIANSDLPDHDKTTDRLTQEARTLVGAGTETTGSTLEAIVFFVLTNPDIKTRLKAELKACAAQDGGTLTSSETIKGLPYLTAVIKEGLRISRSVSGRLGRVDPNNEHIYSSHVLPAGTVMSMNLDTLHRNPTTFPDPNTFNPDRWLTSSSSSTSTDDKNLDKSFAPFGRGARSCIGKELALMNVYLTTAAFFDRFDAELFETRYADLEMAHDFFAPFPRVTSRGLRVLLR